MSHDHPPEMIDIIPATERSFHRELVLQNIEILIETLYAEHNRTHRTAPVACPGATPVTLSRSNPGGVESCCYNQITGGETNEDSCACNDPLSGSDDPLDAVAAVSLGRTVSSPSERFFERWPRQTVASLRKEQGSWNKIASMNSDELKEALAFATPRKGICVDRCNRLNVLLKFIKEADYTSGVTLCGFPNIRYTTIVDFLADLPGIEQKDSWWLLQTAFDKPVWPSDQAVDKLLYNLGLLSPEVRTQDLERHASLEDDLVDRQISTLYRALATHAHYAGADTCGDDCSIRKFLLTHRIQKQRKSKGGPTVVDLFAGAGGLSEGLSDAGFDIRWAIDNEEDAVQTYRLNHPEIPHEHIVCGDVRDIQWTKAVQEVVPEPDLIVGGPPCQSLSQAGYRSRRAQDDDYSILEDDRTTLYAKFVEAIDELRPRAIIMENVEGMVNEVGDTGIRVIDWILEDIGNIGDEDTGYHVEYRVQNMAELGIPQDRDRLLLIGIREDLNPRKLEIAELFENLPEFDAPRTIRQGLAGLPRLRRGEGGRVLPNISAGRKSEYIDENNLDTGNHLCFNHKAREHPMEKDQILFDEGLKPGDTGWDVKFDSDGEYAEYIEYDVGTKEQPRFSDKYRKLEWDKPSPTIVAHLAKDANGFVLPDYYEHVQPDPDRADPKRNRGITPREAARLQSFPDDYIFLGSFTSWFRQIGNAVPPVAGKLLGKMLRPVITPERRPVQQDSTYNLRSKALSDD